MRVVVTGIRIPFIRGGSENLMAGLVSAIHRAGHDVDLVTMPFRFEPVQAIKRSMEIWLEENLLCPNGYTVDRAICLKFPDYYVQHPQKVVWLIHQHRPVYDLWCMPYYGGLSDTVEGKRLRSRIIEEDSRALGKCLKRFTISQNVSSRLAKFNDLDSIPLYHPPAGSDRFYTAEAYPYVFYPSRLETSKRQDLLIGAMAFVRSPVVALLVGSGGQREALERLIQEKGLGSKVQLLGNIDEEEKYTYYAHALGIFFGPFDEDYGYVTLEAMLAAKPVITCTDSGGPLEFVTDGVTGFVVEPEPEAVAEAVDWLYEHQIAARDMGYAGLDRYHSLEISWDRVVERLLS